MYYSKEEKVSAVVDIVKKLKAFPAKTGGTIDLYNKEYPYVAKFKEITMKWINEDKSEFKGFIYFEEINKYFEYKFPSKKQEEPEFVLRMNMFFK
tara:strand:- start:167 stop:451 length:285 start_codon:yes stop_codon:yes gene_type:complete